MIDLTSVEFWTGFTIGLIYGAAHGLLWWRRKRRVLAEVVE
jgi:hypothetical protein